MALSVISLNNMNKSVKLLADTFWVFGEIADHESGADTATNSKALVTGASLFHFLPLNYFDFAQNVIDIASKRFILPKCDFEFLKSK